MSVSVVKGIYLFLRFLKQETNYRIINTKKEKKRKKENKKYTNQQYDSTIV